jgi:hypothetical protein
VIQDVVAWRHRLVHELEPHVTVRTEEIHERDVPVHFTTNPGTPRHIRASSPVRPRSTAWPEREAAVAGGDPLLQVHANAGSSPRTIDSARRAFWKQPPDSTTGSRPALRAGARTSSTLTAAMVLWIRAQCGRPVPPEPFEHHGPDGGSQIHLPRLGD